MGSKGMGIYSGAGRVKMNGNEQTWAFRGPYEVYRFILMTYDDLTGVSEREKSCPLKTLMIFFFGFLTPLLRFLDNYALLALVRTNDTLPPCACIFCLSHFLSVNPHGPSTLNF